MNQADEYFVYLLAEYRKLQKEQKRELRKLPPGQLSVRKKKGKKHYMQLFPEGFDDKVKRVRRGISQNEDMIHALARKKYLQQSLKLLDKNIPALEKLLAVHKAPTPDNIINALPKTYEELPPRAFLPNLRKKNEWAKADYEQNAYRSEAKMHITAQGLKVRSKSEVIIADKLDAYGIPYHYDEMIYIENQSLSPDFIILHGHQQDESYRAGSAYSSDEPKGFMYWEHCGMVNDPAYMRHHKWKLDMYEKAGIVPWKNLILTYDDEHGNIDARLIDAEIKIRLL